MRSAPPRVKGIPSPVSRTRLAPIALVAVATLLSLAMGLRRLDLPGLYYDEAIQALPAVVFLEGGTPERIPGTTEVRWLGRWLPVMTQPYMGALKSQLLVPSFALLGASPASLRGTTFAWTLLGIALSALLARELLGRGGAALCGALMLVDPSLLFVGRHDWGSFALGLVCRSAALYCLLSGARLDSALRLGLGGLFVGLGLYNKIDFAVTALAASTALLLASPSSLWSALRRARLRLAWPALGLLLGAAPMLAALPRTLAVGRSFAERSSGPGSWPEKLDAFAFTLDGSYFQRLILSGGSFPDLRDVEGASGGPGLLLLCLAALALGLRLVAAPARDGRDPARRFVLWTTLLAALGLLATPKAERIHHVLNLVPFPQLLVAGALADLWRLSPRPLRALSALLAAVALAGSLWIDLQTWRAIERTGGRGRWSSALGELASELAERPGSTVVTLDWGLSLPIRFLEPELPVIETVWGPRGGPHRHWALPGGAEQVYLLYPERLSVFPVGLELLDALEALPEGTAELRSHRDGTGELAFLSVRIAEPHRLDYRGALEVRLR